MFIAGFFFVSHLLLDYGSVMWFYPLQTVTYNFLGERVTLEALQQLPHYSFAYLFKGFLEIAALFLLFAIEIKFENKIEKKVEIKAEEEKKKDEKSIKRLNELGWR